MKKMKYKKIFGMFLVISVIAIAGLVFLGISLSKEKVDTTVKEIAEGTVTTVDCPASVLGDNQRIIDKYDIQDELDDDAGTLTISVDPQDPDKDIKEILQKAVFNIVSLNGKAPASAMAVSYGSPIVINMSSISGYKLDDSDDLEIKFKANDIIIPCNDPVCNVDHTCKGTAKFYIDIDNAYGSPDEIRASDGDGQITIQEERPEASEAESESDVLIAGVNCSNINPDDDFQVSYCSLRSSVPERVKDWGLDNITDRNTIDDNGNYIGATLQLKCSVSKINDKNTSSGDEYYSNIKKYKATRILNKPIENKEYVYNFAPGNQHKDATKFGCRIKCTEEVAVKYGPPVAIKAGACFEYQVEATSTVNCKTVELPKPPYTPAQNSCTPRPRCVHHRKNGADVTKNRAGPDDDFDACINSCDGGKYTLKCSEKCYKMVYSNTNQNMLNSFDYDTSQKMRRDYNVTDATQAQLDRCIDISKHYKFNVNRYGYGSLGVGHNHYGCYYWGTDNKIHWDGESVYTPARFYSRHDVSWNYSNYGVNGDGYIRLIKSSGLCKAKCHYSKTSCTQILPNASDSAEEIVRKIKSNEYINPGLAKRDNEANKAIYEAAKAECKAKATCRVTTTKFTIQVNDRGNEVTAINNNMSGITPTPDTLTYDSTTGNNGGQDKSTKLGNSIFLKNYKGCYTNAANTNGKIAYYAKWGFLGACIDDKGAMSNNVKECENGADHYSDQYCTPMNIPKVNEDWWKWYYTKVFNRDTTGVDDQNAASSVESSIFQEKCNFNWKKNNLNGFEPTYNIKAATRNFGYFKWNIDVNCFYAYGTPCNKPECTTNTTPRVRTVDLRNLFPNPQGGQTNVEAIGRAPGFNWSRFATNIEKDANYKSNPSAYILGVQKRGYSIYSSDYLDYEVKLTPENIRTIKALTNDTGFNFGAYESTYTSETNSVINYKSSLLRDTLGGYVKYPSDDQLKCNNIGTNGGCENFN